MDRFRGKLKAKPAHFRSFLNDPASKDFIASLTKSKVSPAYRFMFASNDNCKNFVRYVACVDAYSVEIVAGKFLKRAAVLMWVAPFASLGVAVLSRYLRDGVFNLDSLLVDFSVSFKDTVFSDVIAFAKILNKYFDLLEKATTAAKRVAKLLEPEPKDLPDALSDLRIDFSGYDFHGPMSVTRQYLYYDDELDPHYYTVTYGIAGFYHHYQKSWADSLMPAVWTPISKLPDFIASQLRYLRKCIDEKDYPFFLKSIGLGDYYVSYGVESVWIFCGLLPKLPPKSLYQSNPVEFFKQLEDIYFPRPLLSSVAVSPLHPAKVRPALDPSLPQTVELPKVKPSVRALAKRSLKDLYNAYPDKILDGGAHLKTQVQATFDRAVHEHNRRYAEPKPLFIPQMESMIFAPPKVESQIQTKPSVFMLSQIDTIPSVFTPKIQTKPLFGNFPEIQTEPAPAVVSQSQAGSPEKPIDGSKVKPLYVSPYFPYLPDGEPKSLPLPRLKPYQLPAYRIYGVLNSKGFRVLATEFAPHNLSRPPRHVKETKVRSRFGNFFNPFTMHNRAFYGRYQEIDENTKRFYNALPWQYRRWKDKKTGEWHNKTIDPMVMWRQVFKHGDKLDFVKVLENALWDEVTDRYIGFFGRVMSKVSRKLGIPHFFGLDSLSYQYKKFEVAKKLGIEDKFGSDRPLSTAHVVNTIDDLYMRVSGSENGFLKDFKETIKHSDAYKELTDYMRSHLYERHKEDIKNKSGHVVVKKGDFKVSNQYLFDYLKRTSVVKNINDYFNPPKPAYKPMYEHPLTVHERGIAADRERYRRFQAKLAREKKKRDAAWRAVHPDFFIRPDRYTIAGHVTKRFNKDDKAEKERIYESIKRHNYKYTKIDSEGYPVIIELVDF
ncbi:hypothetical protein [Liberibacter phage pCLasGXNN32]|nr:hypothetical protein pCLasA4_gp05 [Liberibacter phage pCLasA4]QHZ60149.1 hypothetical protein pCLasGDCZ2_gp05 [Liberibacter phage pCLasGDCZ2]QHZ60157.1 hypothetical protein pCLasGDDQ6_gp05 [Liberibacter phage pCLasGDDQ6]QHZ60165.1 hypothetical protein pCLasGDDQ7_gp05 [Liberibacter phage pCLasGDDQ7]QHZ60173.1 hypothetical protein pCLasGDQY1_gp05 [Liberibacter phage pCLasGDQY1]QHZ60181.1 hypothetical protein pCLasGDXH1_gp05 [Liberibacter phage pCLasGDXH1]QHZ60197.1 hypothetical protein pCLas